MGFAIQLVYMGLVPRYMCTDRFVKLCTIFFVTGFIQTSTVSRHSCMCGCMYSDATTKYTIIDVPHHLYTMYILYLYCIEILCMCVYMRVYIKFIYIINPYTCFILYTLCVCSYISIDCLYKYYYYTTLLLILLLQSTTITTTTTILFYNYIIAIPAISTYHTDTNPQH